MKKAHLILLGAATAAIVFVGIYRADSPSVPSIIEPEGPASAALPPPSDD